jgi:hypothetical protein
MFFRWTLPESEKEQKNKTARRCVDAMRVLQFRLTHPPSSKRHHDDVAYYARDAAFKLRPPRAFVVFTLSHVPPKAAYVINRRR